MNWLGIDIGGANLKFASTTGHSWSVAFPIWQRSSELAVVLRNQLREFLETSGATSLSTPHPPIAITMTAELADCFRDKPEGVCHVIESCQQAIGRFSVYSLDGFLDPQVAIRNPYRVAAANWHAMAIFAKRFLRNANGMVADCGSTTTDVVPIVNDQLAIMQFSDTGRLRNGTLTYTGVKRTPLCAVADRLPYRDADCPLSSEFFATTADAYILLGEIPESVDDCETADGRSKTKQNCLRRIGKMFCADHSEYSIGDATAAANAVKQKQKEQINRAIERVRDNARCRFASVVVSGEGEFLLAEIFAEFGYEIISMAERFSARISNSFAAFAVAQLAAESEELTDRFQTSHPESVF